MAQYYASNTQYQTALNECLRHLQASYQPAASVGSNGGQLVFGNGNAAYPSWSTPPDAFGYQSASVWGQPPAINSAASPKKSWLKKLLVGAGVSVGLYWVGKRLLSGVGKTLAENLTEAVVGKAVGQVSETLSKASAESASQATGSKVFPSLKQGFETLQSLGIKPETVASWFSSKGGQGLLTFAKSDWCVNILKTTVLGVAAKSLPEPAIKLLEAQLTPDNIRHMLDAGVLSSVLKYGAELYAKNSGSLRGYLQANADTVATQLARLTGFQKDTIANYLKQFQ
ncbi:hypothetical protein [Vampirovibrio sp.]|uniref:hypothetical protein n=1 Tax=Vampirovibrio sp. TaxID=2717857 RepID=UPI00359398D2